MNSCGALRAGPADSSSADAPGGDWIDAMRSGDFERAWAINDLDVAALCRFGPEKHTGPRHLQRIWRGEELSAKQVLVRCYHGLGDTIQFVRFMPLLRAIVHEVTLWCQPELLALLERAEGVDRAIPLHEGTPDVDFDVDIEIMEVPHAIRAARGAIQMRLPYLTLPREEAWPLPGAGDRFAVGLVWEVGDWDKRRAVPAALLRRLNAEGVTLYSLQRGSAAALAAEIGAKDISTADICELGRRMRQLDLVICVDTMVAHLAGALGCEALVLLHSECDWRWPAFGDSTMWYPSLRLSRQRAPGDWSDVIEDARSALLQRARAKQAGR
jgi:hypothetical protein